MTWTRTKIVGAIAVFVVAIAAAVGIANAIGGLGTHDSNSVSGNFADLRARVSAINRERRESDSLPPAAQQALAGRAGEQLPADALRDARRVFDGTVAGPVYVVPTKAGFALVSKGGISLVQGTLGDENPTAGWVEQRTPASPVTALGIATDDVVQIDVVAGGKSSTASLKHNGYEWVADAPAAIDDVHLLVHMSDGRVIRG